MSVPVAIDYFAGLREATSLQGLQDAYMRANEVGADTSDFKAAYAARAQEIRESEPALREELKAVVRRGTQLLAERLEDDGAPDQLVLRAVEVGARALGLGNKVEAVASSTVNMNVYLGELAQNLVALLRQKKREALVIDGGSVDEAKE